MSITIRPAAEPDVPVILDLIRQLAIYERLEHEVVATEDRVRKTLFGAKPSAEAILAEAIMTEDARECVGFALFFESYSTFLAQPGIYLEDLFVKPHVRGKGVGSALLQHLAAIAMERNCGRMEWGVLNWNEPSIQFYKNLGAVPMDEWTKYRLTGNALERLATKVGTAK